MDKSSAEFFTAVSKKLKELAKDIDSFVNENQQELLFDIEKKEPKKKDEVFIPLKELFMKYYKMEKGVEYYWLAKDSVALKRLVAKIKSVGNTKTDNEIIGSFALVLKNLKDIGENFVYDNLGMTMLDMNFNKIIAKINQSSGQSEKDKIIKGMTGNGN